MIYLAVPYSHPNPAIRASRFIAANRCAAKLVAQGKYVFSPISHSHPIACEETLPTGWEYWRGYDMHMMCHCTGLNILSLPGWQMSVGVQAELEEAYTLGLELRWLDPEYWVRDYFSLACAQITAHNSDL